LLEWKQPLPNSVLCIVQLLRCNHYGDPDPTSAGTAGEAARRGGSSAVVGMATTPFGAHQVGPHIADRSICDWL